MMYPDYTNYEIESLDIWSYEVDLFNHNRTATERIEKVECNLISFLQQARRENIRNVNGGLIRPIAESSLDKNEMHNDYYRKYLNLWENKKGILLERIMEGIYMELDEFYNLQENIKISPSTEGFHYWFALKLSQYDYDVTYIGEFLEYQLNRYYDSKVDTFIDFLSDVILQYDNEILSERIVIKAKTWISFKNKVSNESEKGNTSDYETFQLKELESKPNLLKEEYVEHAILTLWMALKDDLIVSTPISNFEAIFSDRKIKTDNRVIWKRGANSLSEFISLLIESECLVKISKGNQWYIGQDCFVGVSRQEFKYNQLSKPSSKPSVYKTKIEEAVKDFKQNLQNPN